MNMVVVILEPKMCFIGGGGGIREAAKNLLVYIEKKKVEKKGER